MTSDANSADSEPRDVDQPRSDDPHRITVGGSVSGHVVAGDGALADAIMFGATAVGSGVLGNAAYDSLKGAVKRLLGRHAVDSTDGIVRVTAARLAVQSRCAEVGFRVPGDEEACRVSSRADGADTLFQFEYRDLVAEVRVPGGGLGGQMLAVLLRKIVD